MLCTFRLVATMILKLALLCLATVVFVEASVIQPPPGQNWIKILRFKCTICGSCGTGWCVKWLFKKDYKYYVYCECQGEYTGNKCQIGQFS